jgi:polysaccharide biosynthesis/export protein
MTKLTQRCVIGGVLVVAFLAGNAPRALAGQRGGPAPSQRSNAPAVKDAPSAAVLPLGYSIGPDDILSIVYWRDKDMTMDVQVRPDGMISLPLINEVLAAGQTPEQLREKLTEESKKYIEDPNITVIVKEIRSRRVFIQGQVAKQGEYKLSGPTNVLQLISLAGGLGEYADSKNIMVLRVENGKQVAHKVNYKEVISGKKLAQNIELKPGDTVVVP